jgi:hypothetical protein
VRLSKKRPVHGGEVRLGRKGPSSSMERWRQQDEDDNCRSMAWRRRRVPREQIMNGGKAQDHADIATPRQPAMDKRHSPFRRRRSTVGPTAERSGHVGYPTLSLFLLADGGAGRAWRWILARERGARVSSTGG